MPPDGRALLRGVRVAVLAVVAVVVVALAWTAVVLLSVRSDLQSLGGTARSLEAADGGAESARAELERAERTLSRTSGRLTQPGPLLAAQLPVLGRTPEAVRRTSDAALEAVQTAQAVLDEVETGALVEEGRLDVDRLARVQEQLARGSDRSRPAAAQLAAVETALVPGVVADAVQAARERLLTLPEDLAGYAEAIGALRSLAGAEEPRELLVVLQNNAELRGTGGLVSVFATATARDGTIRLDGFRDVEEVADSADAARRVPAPADYRSLFGPLLADTTLWKNTNADPDVPTSSQVLAEVARTSLGRAPDAVVWLDARAVAAVLAGTSPATLPDGRRLTADNAVEELLVASYDDAVDTEAGQRARRERLRAAADAVAVRLLTGSPDLTRLGPELAAAARGRHLSVWSADAAEQAGWRAAGLSGEVAVAGGDLLSVTVHNLGDGGSQGNKLDFYARRTVSLTALVTADQAEVVQKVTLRNEAPKTGLPVYVAGTVAPGTSNDLVLLTVPGSARIEEFRRGASTLRVEPQRLRDGQVLSDVVTLPPGTATEWTVRYRLPVTDLYRLALVPQPLAVDAELEVELRAGDGVRLLAPPGSKLVSNDDGQQLAYRGTFADRLDVRAEVRHVSRLQRLVDGVRRWWSEPVQLP